MDEDMDRRAGWPRREVIEALVPARTMGNA